MIAQMLVLVPFTACAQSVTTEPPCEIAQKMGPPYYTGVVMPTPKQATYGDEYLTLIDGPGGRRRCWTLIQVDGPCGELLGRLLDARISAYTEQFAPPPAEPDTPRTVRIAYASEDSDRPGGYTCEITPDGAEILASTNAGLVNGLASFLQLMHVRDGKLVVRCAHITDWPTFETRYTSEYWLPGTGFHDWMMVNKINGFAACYPGMRWQGDSEEKRAGLREIGDYIEAYGTMSFLVEYHIGGRGGCPAIDCGDEAQIEQLLATIGETLQLSHASHVMICYDDVAEELQPEESKRFERPTQAHGYVMERVYDHVKSIDPNCIVSFCSPWYQGRGHPKWTERNARLDEAKQYMADLKQWKNRDIRIVWTGPVTESRLIVQEDIDHYLGMIGEDRKLFYWDNTWHYHQPLRNFHAKYLDGFVDSCADSTSYINVNGVQPIGRFFAVTANDYYWNPEAFDSKRSRRHAVAQFMGPQAVPAAEALYRLRGEDYFVFFSRDVDLEALDAAVTRVEESSLNEALGKLCRTTYEGIAEKRRGAE